MTLLKTKVINKTGEDVLLKLSTGGVLFKLTNGPLLNGEHYCISIDSTTTYREYWCAVKPNALPQDNVILNTDICQEFSEVTLSLEKPPYVLDGSRKVVTWKGTKARDSKETLHGSSSLTTPLQNGANGPEGTTPISTPVNANRASPRSDTTRRQKSRCTIL